MIRQAELTDFSAITRIRESTALDINRVDNTEYRVKVQYDGFLFPTRLSITDFQSKLSKYSVDDKEGQVLGYFRLRYDQDIPDDTTVAWLKPELKDIYWSNPHAGLDGIGVLPQAKRHGLGTEMLQEAEQQVRLQGIPWLFSFVVLTPVTNFASMMLHEKNGYERIAILGPSSYTENGFHLDIFQSILYGKHLPNKV